MAKDLAALRDEAAGFVERGRNDKAIACYIELEQREPMSAQWPKKIAELERKAGDDAKARAATENPARSADAADVAKPAVVGAASRPGTSPGAPSPGASAAVGAGGRSPTPAGGVPRVAPSAAAPASAGASARSSTPVAGV